MNAEEELIISLLRSFVSGKLWIFSPHVLKKGVNWASFKELISYHEVYSYLYPVVKDSAKLFPADIITFFKNNYFYGLAHCQRLLREFLRISAAFKEAKIRVVPLKGMAFLQDTYSHIPARPTTDIDLLVEKINLPLAKEILLDLDFLERLDGLKPSYWLEKQCHIEFIKKESGKDIVWLDLHFGLDFKRKRTEILPELWTRACGGILSPEDALFSLALHQRRFGRALCLKNVVDAGLILKKYQGTFDWDYVIRQAKSGRMRSTMFFFLTQVKILFDSEIRLPDLKVLCPNYFKRKLIRFFIKNNVFSDSFGKKAKELYLKSHFLLYDSLWEPVDYILNIPQEQFAKFYGVQPYNKKTEFFYKNRLFYIFFKAIFILKDKHCKRDVRGL